MRQTILAGTILASLLLAATVMGTALVARAPTQQTPGASTPGLAGVLAIEDARAPSPDDVRVLLTAARSTNTGVQQAAIRALGRLERGDLIPELLPYLRARDAAVAEEAGIALLLAFRGQPLAGMPADRQLQAALDALAVAPGLTSGSRALGRLPYTTAAQFRQAEERLSAGIASTTPSIGALRGLESLARLRRTLLPFQDQTLERLRAIASRRDRAYTADQRRNAMAALTASLGADTDTVATAFKDEDAEVRRLAALSAAGAGAAIDAARRIELIRDALSDSSPLVRLEALKGWVKHGVATQGCTRVMTALADASPNVVLYAIDALGGECKDDVVVTDRLTEEARAPGAAGPWHRPSHALVSLARRAPDRAVLVLPGFVSHARWQVRMYAARATAVTGDVPTLRRLAADETDNVKEAALPALRRLQGAGSDDLFLAALGRPDYQLLRTAARELKGSTPSPVLAGGLREALARVTAEKKETSRDPRMAIIERLGELGTDADAAWLRPLLRDFDPVVATAAAALLRQWTHEDVIVDPQLLAREALPDGRELGEEPEAVVTMDGGGTFVLTFATRQAPLTRTRFLRLARARYYDGLTFHRAVANAFIQGGSPGANEYAGDRLYMRDEVGVEMHTRGTVGISTRGRDTGDAQIFINLVDNPFLDFEYTVFAQVCDGMETLDLIQEGDRIERIQIQSRERCK